jgi:hypothetical protein
MNALTDFTYRLSSSDPEVGAGRALVFPKSDEAQAGSRLRSIIFIMASITATVGWLWFLVDVAEWLIGV